MARHRQPHGLSESERWVIRAQHRYELWRLGLKFLGAALLVFLAVPLPVMLGEGKQTVITLTYQAILEGKLADKLQKALIAALVLLTYAQRRYFMRRLKHLGGRQRELELKVDPNRSSSTPKGVTGSGEKKEGA